MSNSRSKKLLSLLKKSKHNVVPVCEEIQNVQNIQQDIEEKSVSDSEMDCNGHENLIKELNNSYSFNNDNDKNDFIDINEIDTFIFINQDLSNEVNNEDNIVNQIVCSNHEIEDTYNVNEVVVSQEGTDTFDNEQANSENITEFDDENTPDMFGKKKSNKRSRIVNKFNYENGNSYKKSKKNKEFEICASKKMKENPCFEKLCTNECTEINDDERLKIFHRYWKELDHSRKRDYLLSCMEIILPKRSYVTNSNRTCNYKYFMSVNNTKKTVCRRFLLNTLDISEKVLRYTRDNKVDLHTSKPDSRGNIGSRTPTNKTPHEKMIHLEEFINMLPAVPSHYCRSSTSKKYISSDFNSLNHVYRFYVEHCNMKNITPVSNAVFKNKWNTEYNIGIHAPKKDKCAFCEGYKNKDTKTEEDTLHYTQNIEEKIFTTEVFKKDQEKSGQNGFLCCSFDLQKVLNTPWGNSMLLFYSRKLAYYNLSIYESKTKNGYCYLWSEVDGQRGSNEISSILFKYLKSIDMKGNVYEIAFYCDNCPGQNKNHNMLSMLRHFLLKYAENIKIITINYLLAGHSYMPVDSIHACIDKNIKKKTIWAPSEWPTVIRNSRSNIGPYETIILNYSDFLNWNDICNATFNKTKLKDTMNCDVKFKSIRKVKFSKDNLEELNISYTFKPGENGEDDYKTVNLHTNARLRSTCNTNPVLKPQYKEKLPVTAAKYKDLRNLCLKKIIPEVYHSEYFSIPFKPSVLDVLPETDDEDEID
ncbi:unnamed protein product [Macrosiphum euphorbiae]|uniref:DUF7869 domain-containing protein n=2 Tax=Macrosiphum euphorbiae TaxID=13131 RepID=A0AAV0Y3S7_9HEMI|nr:unnamed protein product [Macrosiphum euphorbiae]